MIELDFLYPPTWFIIMNRWFIRRWWITMMGTIHQSVYDWSCKLIMIHDWSSSSNTTDHDVTEALERGEEEESEGRRRGGKEREGGRKERKKEGAKRERGAKGKKRKGEKEKNEKEGLTRDPQSFFFFFFFFFYNDYLAKMGKMVGWFNFWKNGQQFASRPGQDAGARGCVCRTIRYCIRNPWYRLGASSPACRIGCEYRSVIHGTLSITTNTIIINYV